MLKALVHGAGAVVIFVLAFCVLCIPHALGMPDGVAAVSGLCLMMGYAVFVGEFLNYYDLW